jgi:hypothetical protein
MAPSRRSVAMTTVLDMLTSVLYYSNCANHPHSDPPLPVYPSRVSLGDMCADNGVCSRVIR